MITIFVKWQTNNHNAGAFEKILKALAKESLSEKGCVSYEVHVEIQTHEEIYVLVENYISVDALIEHQQTDHYKKYVPELEGLAICDPEILITEVL